MCRNCKSKTILLKCWLSSGPIAVDKKQCYEVVGKISSSMLVAHQRMFLASSPTLRDLAPGAGDDQVEVREQSPPPASPLSERGSRRRVVSPFLASLIVNSFVTWHAHIIITCTTLFSVISCSCSQHLLLPSPLLSSLHTLSG